jgi:IS1 family transposase
MSQSVNTELSLFCPCQECNFYQKIDNKITKDGSYKTKSDKIPRQMYYCHAGKHRFSETRYSNLFQKQGSFKEYEMASKMACYGLSQTQIADILERDVRTIEEWFQAIGKKSEQFHLFICITLKLKLFFLQMDELWSFCKAKNHQLWVFVAFEAQSKFWIGFELGSRTNHTASRLVAPIKRFSDFASVGALKITTDKLAAYKNALKKHFVNIKYHYLQIVKQRFKRRLVTVKKCFVKGTKTDFPSKTQNTSFIERFNLTLRQHVSYLTRKTLGYCKKKVNFKCNLWINLYNYNYIQFHKSLRVKISKTPKKFKKHYQHYTPAMKMGLTQTALTWRYLLTAPIPTSY